MKRISIAAAAAFGVVCSVALANVAEAQDTKTLDALRAKSKIKIEYVLPQKLDFIPIYKRLKERQVLERLQAFLAPLKLPRDLLVRTAECNGQRELPYRSDAPVTICYEYVALIEQVAPPPNQPIAAVGSALVRRDIAIIGPFVQLVLHNTARHAIDLLELPVWGNIEDAADNLAAFIMLEVSPIVAEKTIFGTAYFFMKTNTARINLADIRPHIQQRYYNLLCIAAGKDLVKYSVFLPLTRPAVAWDLPKRRVGYCLQIGSPQHSEYSKVKQAFEELILKKNVDLGLLKQVRAIEWLKDD